MPPEQTVVNAITRLLLNRGAWRVNIHGSGVGRNGIPDILACYRGRFFAIECKAPNGRVTRLQQYELDNVLGAGGIAIVARGAQDVAEMLDYVDQQAGLR